ncbi:unnamed protein product [Mytilus coruscus]|uniref:Transposase Helix-turn-helix domain-containing protein n=1 Tax=Mytilus coruscus TaxID=42192 RepID=A0A6J8E9H7_MYTCO|nr:unnamed protein product [Mytilus coruscus]
MKRKKKRALKYIVAAIAAKRRTKKVKRNWTKPWLTRRADLGVCQTLLKELSNEDSDSFRNFLRVSPQQFAYLLDMVKDSIKKSSTNMRTCITAEERLSLTLRYLATGESYRSLSYSFRIAPSTVCSIIPEVCDALYQALKDTYLKCSIDFAIGYYSLDTIAYLLALVGLDEALVGIDCEVLDAEKNFDIAG